MKKHTVKVRTTKPKRASAVVDAVLVPARSVASSFSVVVEYGERNTRSLSFEARRGLKALKAHVCKTCHQWTQMTIDMPKGNRLVLRNPRAIRVLS